MNHMTAEIIAVGTELLLGHTVDSNSALLGKALSELGIDHYFRQTVGDNRDRLVQALLLALGRSDLVVTIGGLGPTQDDLTRDAISEATGLRLIEDAQLLEQIRHTNKLRGHEWIPSLARQALIPEGSRVLRNSVGSAPGFICHTNEGRHIAALPGPKGEFEAMVKGPLSGALRGLGSGRAIVSRVLKVCGMPEAAVERKVRELLDGQNPTLAPYAKPGETHLRISASASTDAEARELIVPLEDKVRAALGDAVFGVDDDELEEVTLALLAERGGKIAVAESCTGGLLGARMSRCPGVSSVFLGGVISYSPEVKHSLLGVSRELLERFGAVSAECAEAMATGVARLLGATHALSVTGVAGPEPSEGKSIGLVFVAYSGPDGAKAEEHRFGGSREAIRQRATQAALVLLRRRLLR